MANSPAISTKSGHGSWRLAWRVLLVSILVFGSAGGREAEPAIDTEKLVRMFTIGVDQQNFLGHPVDALWLPRGQLLVLDKQLNSVEVYDGDGEWLRSIGQEGEGPGQFQSPVTLFTIGGDRFGVADASTRRVSIFHVDGQLIEDRSVVDSGVEFGGLVTLLDAEQHRDLLVTVEKLTRFDRGNLQNMFRISTHPAGGSAQVVYQEQHSLDITAPVLREQTLSRLAASCWALTAGSRIVVAPLFTEYALEIYDLASGERVLVRNDYEPIARSPQYLKRMEERAATLAARGDRPFRFEPSPVSPAIRELHAAVDGGFWVRLTTRADESGAPTPVILDQYNEHGERLRTVHLVSDHNIGQSDIRLFDDVVVEISQATEDVEAHVSLYWWIK